MNMPQEQHNMIHRAFYDFINDEVLPLTKLDTKQFWQNVAELVEELGPLNSQLLLERQRLQSQIDEWLKRNKDSFDAAAYQKFLRDINYLVDEGEDFCIATENVDEEIAHVAGPQLVVPLKNARFALNAANARWGSLYDALYGSDLIPQSDGLEIAEAYNPLRGAKVVELAKNFLDDRFPLSEGSHKDVSSYVVYFQHLLAIFPNGDTCGLQNPGQFVALSGSKTAPESVLLQNNGLHVEICLDRSGNIGSTDRAGIQDIVLEAALSTIVDCEDSVSAVDGDDKIEVYRNWLGLIRGDLTAEFKKGKQTLVRRLNVDRHFTGKNGNGYDLPGRSLLLIRNVGHLMCTDLIKDAEGHGAPEGIVDAVVSALIGSLDLEHDRQSPVRNSRSGSIYIVKPKMHGPKEVAFACHLFSRVEELVNLPRNTLKIGIMDEERRTTLNLKACIREAKERVFFINTGFLDRTGDEIHTSMEAGPFLPKQQLKSQAWIKAYENWNVDVGLACGLQNRAQIGKGMWAMPDEMNRMMQEKIAHPLSGANTAWVPSPTAATLHAMHYHQVDVFTEQNKIKHRQPAKLDDILTIATIKDGSELSTQDVERELENNIQGILGYVVRWVDQGIGCSKVPDIHQVGLMEDRATLRISSQHLANWLHHGVCSKAQLLATLERMAAVVDEQNKHAEGYRPMCGNLDNSFAYKAAKALIFDGREQPNGYTEPLLHYYRIQAKNDLFNS
ncbi:MAG: malate synthase G [Cellvibrionaceae bacterium]|nr:malate synthase G [Cellvibrionaceae bacterium]